jgi:hypothetical protein
MLVAWKFQKKVWSYVTDRMPLSIKEDRELYELKRQRALLPVADPGIPSWHLYLEAGFFLALSYLPIVAAWRWYMQTPLAVGVDFRQIIFNSAALVLLFLLYLQVKGMNQRLAADLDRAIAEFEARRKRETDS